MRFDIITIFPKIFDSYFNESIIKRAREKKLVEIKIYNLRDFAADERGTVDGRPYGGGAGMVLMAEPILKAVNKLISYKFKSRRRKKLTNLQTYKLKTKIIILSAKGKQFNQKLAYGWSKKYNKLILISGRYEGIDERVKKILRAEEISIGPYVLTDGEVPTMAIISAVTRLLPGVIKSESLREESHSPRPQVVERSSLRGRQARGIKGELEYPHYTRPEILKYKGKAYKAPKILLSGNHKKIEDWRNKKRK